MPVLLEVPEGAVRAGIQVDIREYIAAFKKE